MRILRNQAERDLTVGCVVGHTWAQRSGGAAGRDTGLFAEGCFGRFLRRCCPAFQQLPENVTDAYFTAADQIPGPLTHFTDGGDPFGVLQPVDDRVVRVRTAPNVDDAAAVFMVSPNTASIRKSSSW